MTTSHGGDRKSDQARKSDLEAVTIERAAKEANISADTAQKGYAVVRSGDLELISMVESRKLSINKAAERLRSKQQNKEPAQGTIQETDMPGPNPKPAQNTNDPGGGSDAGGADDDDSNGDRYGAPSLLEGAGEAPLASPEPVDNTVEAAESSNQSGGVGDDRSDDEHGSVPDRERTPDALTPIVEEPAIDGRGLFRPDELPIFPPPKAVDGKATPPRKTAIEEETAPSNRVTGEQSAVSFQDEIARLMPDEGFITLITHVDRHLREANCYQRAALIEMTTAHQSIIRKRARNSVPKALVLMNAYFEGIVEALIAGHSGRSQ